MHLSNSDSLGPAPMLTGRLKQYMKHESEALTVSARHVRV